MFTQTIGSKGLGAGILLGVLGTVAIVEGVVIVSVVRETGSVAIAVAALGGCVLSIVLLSFFRALRITIGREGVRVAFGPFGRTEPLGGIVAARATTYRPLAEFGGWGIRYGRRGWMWNVLGDGGRAVELELQGGKRLLFSSPDPEAAVAAIEEARASVA